MKNLVRHSVERGPLEHLLRRDCQRLDEFVQYARESYSNLTGLHGFVAKNVYLSGAVVAPDSAEVARALWLSAQALGAVFAFRLEPPPDAYELGEGPPVCYGSVADPRVADILIWRDAYDLGLIARQSPALGYLCRVTKDTFRGSSLTGYTDEEYRFMELKQHAWSAPSFSWEPLLAWCEAHKARSAEISRPEGAEHVRCVGIPYLRVLRKLGEGDESGLQADLTDALTLHKRYWTAKAARRKELTGLVSLPLLALAALAWDRGLRFRVESDYLPWSWVTGDLFK